MNLSYSTIKKSDANNDSFSDLESCNISIYSDSSIDVILGNFSSISLWDSEMNDILNENSCHRDSKLINIDNINKNACNDKIQNKMNEIKSFNLHSYVDLLISYFMLSINDQRVKKITKNSKNNEVKINNNKEMLAFCKNNFNNKPIDISDEIMLLSNISNDNLNDLMKITVETNYPNFKTFVITFMLMDSFIETEQGLMYIEKINRVFLSCFYIASYHFEYNDKYNNHVLMNTHFQKILVNVEHLTTIQEILSSKSSLDYSNYRILFEKLFIKLSNDKSFSIICNRINKN
jgi:hypothetical protein